MNTTLTHIKQSLRTHRTMAITIGILAAVIIALGITYALMSPPESTDTAEITLQTMTLYPNPDVLDFRGGALPTAPASFEVPLYVNANGQIVTGARLEIIYDPTVIEAIAVIPSEQPTSLLGENPTITTVHEDRAYGSMIVALSPNATPRTGDESLATLLITFRENVTGDRTEIVFGPESDITTESNLYPPLEIVNLEILFDSQNTTTSPIISLPTQTPATE